MANPLDWLGRAALRMGGMSPQQIRQQVRAGKKAKPMPKAKAAAAPKKPEKPPISRQSRVNGRLKPGPDTRGNRPIPPKQPPRPPAPGSIQPEGQTSLLKRDGTARDFRKPAQAANRRPTLDPVQQRSKVQATPPKPPVGGPGRQSPGQGHLNLGADKNTGIKDPWGKGTKPNRALVQSEKPRKAPSLPKEPPKAAPKASTPTAKPASGAVKAVKGAAGVLGKAGSAAGFVGTAAATVDQARKVLNPKNNIVTSLKDLGTSVENLNARPGKKQQYESQNAVTKKANERVRAQNIKDRAKPNIKPPSAAKQATDKRDKKKLF